MEIALFVLAVLGILGACFSPFWFHFFWRRTFAHLGLSPAERVFTEMVKDLVSEDLWEEARGFQTYRHKDSGVDISVGWESAEVRAGGNGTKLNRWHPAMPYVERLHRHMKRKAKHAKQTEALAGMNAAYRRMRDLH